MNNEQDPIADLLARIARGDAEASNELFGIVQTDVLALVRKRMGERLRARDQSVDIAQSVLGDIVKNLERVEYRGAGALHQMLARYVENKLLERARKMKHGDRSPERVQPIGPPNTSDDSDRGVDPVDPGDTPSVIMSRAEQLEQLSALLAQLSPRERRLVELREIEQLDWDAVVERAGEPTKKAAQQCHSRAMARLSAQRHDSDTE